MRGETTVGGGGRVKHCQYTAATYIVPVWSHSTFNNFDEKYLVRYEENFPKTKIAPLVK